MKHQSQIMSVSSSQSQSRTGTVHDICTILHTKSEVEMLRALHRVDENPSFSPRRVCTGSHRNAETKRNDEDLSIERS